jgi:4-diphosphocytidyl-2-C-methyl-D-erythritol kinase
VNTVAYRCFAKINLTLEVIGRRDDGYHDLASLVHTIDLADDLFIESSDGWQCHVQGLALDPTTNLVNRAARLLASTAGVSANADVTLVKRIAAAAGLGGGSSDAASALVGLNALWGTGLDRSEGMHPLAGKLGSDVPFFLNGGAAVMRGRGEVIEELPALANQWLVLVVPPHALSDKTTRLYAALEPRDFSSGEATARAAARLTRRLPLQPDDLINAFENAARAVFPNLTPLWREAERTCERRFCLSGAGPALFALAEDQADAHLQRAKLVEHGFVAHAMPTTQNARTSLDFASKPPIKYA